MFCIWCMHYLLLNIFLLDASLINKSVALLSQIVGGILIMLSINSNIDTLKQESLYILFNKYLKTYPLFKQVEIINVTPAKFTSTTKTVQVNLVRHPKNIEEEIEYLQEQINTLRQDCEQQHQMLNKSVQYQFRDINTQILENNVSVQDLQNKIEKVLIGNIKQQLFGLLLIVYGATANTFSQLLLIQ